MMLTQVLDSDNSGPVTHLLQTFLPNNKFTPIVTREFRPPKPHPAGILHIASAWGLEDGGEGLIMVRSFLTSSLNFLLVSSYLVPAFPLPSCMKTLLPRMSHPLGWRCKVRSAADVMGNTSFRSATRWMT